MSRSTPVTVRRGGPARAAWTRLLGALAAALLIAGLTAGPAAAADLTVEARALLEGHARVGSWMAISVDLRNDGPAIQGELHLAGGAQGRTRFAVPVDLPTQSAKTYTIYGQPPAFGSDLEVSLSSGGAVLATEKVTFKAHDQAQLVVGIVAESPESIIESIDLPANQGGLTAAIVPLGPDDLPARVEAWAPLDRLVMQDVDTNALTTEQRNALRGWVAAGGRLVLIGGTGGPGLFAGLPDELLPYRPTATVDAPSSSLTGLLGELDDAPATVPALGGELLEGRVSARAGDRVIGAERSFGTGTVTVLGFDPTADWIAESSGAETLWRGLLPSRIGVPLGAAGDDSQLINAVATLPSLALPPVTGLLILLVGYIALIGPVNYIVLRRLDRREWAWITMPVLIIVFAIGSYGFGAALRGSDIVVNQVAIVRGAPNTTEGTAQVYLGIFSPTRDTYQVRVPGGALLSAPLNMDFFAAGQGSALDVVQGETSQVRDLAVGFGSLRAVRAESAVAVPRIEANLRLENNRLVGRIRNMSDRRLERTAIVYGSNTTTTGDLEPGASKDVTLMIGNTMMGQTLSDRIIGQPWSPEFDANSSNGSEMLVRRSIIDQLTWDPQFGSSGTLPAEGPVLLAWGTGDILPIEIDGHTIRRTGQILYYMPLSIGLSGDVVFPSDLVRGTVLETDAQFFSKDPWAINIGRGEITMAYRPSGFQGTIEPSRLVVALGFGGEGGIIGGQPTEVALVTPREDPEPAPGASAEPAPTPMPIPECPEGIKCGVPVPMPPDMQFNALPSVEILDLETSTWMSLPSPVPGVSYAIADPGRYVDAGSGTVQVRFESDLETISFQFGVQIEGRIE